MTDDVRRPRLTRLARRVPGTQRYRVTPRSSRVALLFTKLDACVFRPTGAASAPTEPAPRPLADALAAVDRQLDTVPLIRLECARRTRGCHIFNMITKRSSHPYATSTIIVRPPPPSTSAPSLVMWWLMWQ